MEQQPETRFPPSPLMMIFCNKFFLSTREEKRTSSSVTVCVCVCVRVNETIPNSHGFPRFNGVGPHGGPWLLVVFVFLWVIVKTETNNNKYNNGWPLLWHFKVSELEVLRSLVINWFVSFLLLRAVCWIFANLAEILYCYSDDFFSS